MKWYKIQEEILNSSTDILLLLDCCYAAQAGRDRKDGRGKFEVMAAAAMGMKTPGAGDRSFTNILLRELKLAVEQRGFVSMKDLHGHLCGRKQDLYATPVHISLKPGHSPLLLKPFQLGSRIAGFDTGRSGKSFLHLLVEVKEAMTVESAGRIHEWLREDIPHFVSNLDVFQKTENIHQVVQDVHQGEKKFAQQIGETSKNDIAHAWATVLALVERYQQSRLTSHGGDLEADSVKKRRALKFLCQLDSQGSEVVDVLEESILATSAPANQDILEETAEDENIRALGIDSQLHIRRMVILSESQTVPPDPANTEGEILHPCVPGSLIIQEIKPYGSYVNPSELPALHYRLSLLAKLLGTPKSKDFRSLKCVRWSHKELAHTYTLDFEVPSIYERCQYMDLNSVIRQTKGQDRPTLNSRMGIASTIVRAVQKWHSVGWVHQGISSHNIIFFFKNGDLREQLDYSEPFLKGFEFSRPDSDPSIGRATDDVNLILYRHPERQGVARKGHQKKHDIYSLGVVLLEVGLWQSASDLITTKPGQPAPLSREIHSKLRRHCTHRLAHFVGTSYQKTVSRCLDLDFGVSIDDEAGSRLAEAFRDHVADQLTSDFQLQAQGRLV